ncbi:diguanylate cyclase (GGDEF)-like protein/PAS domain S-box-containing protein [Rheinheimera pacifica]|uniref:EAL domain-containing protein n=1 Tax=Rheinheimera pacifica TaxID=173990 RepID=UPI0028674C4D|nr:EAL domain-containing protein [Rheinheimera pacifica]MDR6981898.1 diguanylate cyclase (GGDEF)-like protein/PAS domain S-box-containing protein [Rheinheimera pacifica]
MRTGTYCLLLLIWLFTLPARAFHAEVNMLHSPLPEQQRLQQVYFQVTPLQLGLDDILADPEKQHAFSLLAPSQQVLFAEHQVVWLFARLQNNSHLKRQVVLEYDFPMADKIEIYQRNRQTQDVRLLSRSGNDYPYTERALPYRSYAVSLDLAAHEQTDIFIRVQDAALVPSDLLLWRYNSFIAYSQKSAILDGLLQGVLLLLAFYNLVQFFRLKAKNYLYYSAFFVSFALVIAVLNGMAFAMLWPGHPEVNQAILYISVGTALLCLNLFIHHALQHLYTPLWRRLGHASSFAAMLLLFSPLYASGQMRLLLLFLALGWVLGSNIVLAVRFTLAGQPQARSFVWACVFTLCSALLLTLSQAGYLNTGFDWLYLLQLLMLFSLALTSFGLQKIPRQSDANSLSISQLQQYHDIFHNAVEGMFTTTLDGKLLNANNALLNILGYDTLDQLKQAVSDSGMARFYADPTERQMLVRQLELGNNKSFEIKGLRADHSPFWALMSARLARSVHNRDAFVHGSVIDITEQKLAHEQLAYLANHDSLTALYNRFYFEQQLQTLCQQGGATAGCMLYIDIDQFKLINNNCSHSAGNALLKQLSEVFKRTLGHNGPLARLDSDEFGVLLTGKNANEAFALAYRLLDAVKEFRFIWQDSIYPISVSIGIAEISGNNIVADDVIKQADAACSIAKDKGRNRIQLFDSNDLETQRHQAEMQWVAQLRDAIAQDRFVLYQQPIQALKQQSSGLHYEVLLRLHGEDNTLIGPGSFLSSAERFGLMPQIDLWVIRHYFRWLQQNPQHLQQLQLCCINLSGSSLVDSGFKEQVQQLFTDYQIPYQRICFEITESVAIVNLQNTLSFIQFFRGQGCLFALDDFGSGFSSYSYLKHFPADFIKIDGHFVRDLLDDQYNKAIVKSIHEVAKAVGMRTIAEYVETEAVRDALQLLGVDYVQGYAIARPMPLLALSV